MIAGVILSARMRFVCGRCAGRVRCAATFARRRGREFLPQVRCPAAGAARRRARASADAARSGATAKDGAARRAADRGRAIAARCAARRAAANARAPVLLRRLVGTEHAFALVAVRALEAFPPVGELDGNLAAVAAQPEKIVSGAEARMLEQPERPLAGALLEPRLQRPRFLDRRFETTRDRESLGLLREHAIHCREQRGHRPLTFCLRRVPAHQYFVPEQRREQKGRSHRLAGPHALVGTGERELDEPRAQRLLEYYVEQRQHAMMQAAPAEALERLV